MLSPPMKLGALAAVTRLPIEEVLPAAAAAVLSRDRDGLARGDVAEIPVVEDRTAATSLHHPWR